MSQIVFTRRAVAVATLAAVFLLSAGDAGRAAEPIAGPRIGALVMHGKGGTPTRHIDALISALKSVGVLVEAPLMPWGKDRIYDRSYEDSLAEIDGYVAKLKAAGAQRIASSATHRRQRRHRVWREGQGVAGTSRWHPPTIPKTR